jgi:hypothetical protein
LPEIWTILTSIILFLLVEWTGRSHEHPIASFGAKWPKAVRWVIFAGMFFAVFWFSGVNQQFFYFQF